MSLTTANVVFEMRQYPDRVVRDAIRYLEFGEYPRGANLQRFAELWRYFHVDGERLVHTGSNRAVISHSKIVPLLIKLYAQPSWKTGRDRFYSRIAELYLGISREDVMNFLRRQETWQLYQPIKKSRTRQVILSNNPLDHWQMDLIDFSAYSALNNGHRYILTVMDCFTKFAWARPIKTKHAASVAAALEGILADPLVMAGRMPKIVQSDNGTEFKEQVSQLLEHCSIKQIFSTPYKPTTQGMIERFNGTLKRALFEHMSQFNTKKWNDVLPEITQGYNASRHSVTLLAPALLMNAAVNSETVDAARTRIHAVARKRLGHCSRSPKFPLLQVGDTVRLSMQTESEPRRLELLGVSNGRQPKWSKELYVVTHVSQPSLDALTLPHYRVKSTSDNQELPKRFYRNDLQKIDPNVLMVNKTKRPDYSHGTIFDQETHLRRIQTRKSNLQLKMAEERPRRTSKRSPISSSPRASPGSRSKSGSRSSAGATSSRRRRRSTADHPAEQFYDVAEIMGQRQRNRKQNFLVRWESYPSETDWTWEPLHHIKHAPAFAEWRKKQNAARKLHKDLEQRVTSKSKDLRQPYSLRHGGICVDC